ncbi:MAG TPA: cobalamin-binding protein [Pirellulales bacterium]|jgi:iron complex transport system substrate-binding protein|nr:cobalamin-binding protein [Pirellulales bacterium]
MSSPQRIVSLLASATEILCALGLADRLVAISHECDYPLEVLDRPRVTSTAIRSELDSAAIDEQVGRMKAAGQPLYQVDEARLAALEPDLIVTQAQCDVCAVNYADVLRLAQQRLPGTRVLALNPARLGDLLTDIERVGEATGRQAEARRFIASLQQRIDAVRAQTAAILPDARPLVACIEWIEPLYLAANWMPELIELAGGRQPFSQAGDRSVVSCWESLVEADPDAIIVMPCGFDLARTLAECRLLTERPGWRQLRAVQQGRVYAVDGNVYFNRSGPRLVDSLELLAQLLRRPKTPGEKGVWEEVKSEK